jgi:hypothetical protein
LLGCSSSQISDSGEMEIGWHRSFALQSLARPCRRQTNAMLNIMIPCSVAHTLSRLRSGGKSVSLSIVHRETSALWRDDMGLPTREPDILSTSSLVKLVAYCTCTVLCETCCLSNLHPVTALRLVPTHGTSGDAEDGTMVTRRLEC